VCEVIRKVKAKYLIISALGGIFSKKNSFLGYNAPNFSLQFALCLDYLCSDKQTAK
jgi:hypothetical protein